MVSSILPPSSTRALLTGMSFTEPIHILGAGAMGMLVAASIRCAFPSYPVKLLVRDDPRQAGAAKSRSICLRRGYLSNTATPSLPVSSILEPPNLPHRKRYRESGPRVVHIPCEATSTGRRGDVRDIRNLIVTTKAGSAIEAINSVRHRLWRNDCDDETSPCIILLCNGALAVAEDWQRRQTLPSSTTKDLEPHYPLHLGLVTHGVYKETSTDCGDSDDDLHHVVHAGYGTIHLQGSKDIASLLDLSGLNCTLVPSKEGQTHDLTMQWLLWKKLAANCVINPLTAIHQCLNGEIVHLSRFHDYYFEGILREIANVYTALYGSFGDGDFGNATTVECVYHDLRLSVNTVICDTAMNRSSMRQDVDAGQQTEIDYISGYVVRMGAKVGVPTPVNQDLWHAVQALRING